ncbi:MAG: hypothetical protein AB7I59_05415 [Geminicoccaceae bacterium]
MASSASKPPRPHTIVPAHPGFAIRFLWYEEGKVECSDPEPVIAWFIESYSTPDGDNHLSVEAITPDGTHQQRYLLIYPDGQASLPEDSTHKSLDDAMQELRERLENERGGPTGATTVSR